MAYVRCTVCGKKVSNEVKQDMLVVRAWVECPECGAVYQQLSAMIDAVRNGQNPIVLGADFVVMTREHYEKLMAEGE